MIENAGLRDQQDPRWPAGNHAVWRHLQISARLASGIPFAAVFPNPLMKRLWVDSMDPLTLLASLSPPHQASSSSARQLPQQKARQGHEDAAQHGNYGRTPVPGK
jgi:hypothetical protein